MSHRSIFILSLMALLCCLTDGALGQVKFTLSGTIRDAQNGESLIGVTVYAKGAAGTVGVTTNAYGFYSLSLPPGPVTVTISYVGYSPQIMSLTVSASQKLDVQLRDESKELQEVVVSQTRAQDNVQQVGMSVNRLDIKTIKSIPALLGEVDVVRSLMSLPGVASVGEGGVGFNVRGGAADQNLIIQDEANVYNASHLFGFYSVFNPDAVKDVKLFKGGIPAQYGGRLSSVLDVRLKEGNAKKFSVNGGIGLVSSRLTLEGPIVKDKSSFIISGRRSYADLFLKASPTLRENSLYFYDLTAKWNYTINQNNTLYASGYFGKDNFGFGSVFGLNWGNATGTLRWNHVYTPKLFANYTFAYSKYTYNLNFSNGGEFNWAYDIKNYNLKADHTYYLNAKNTISFGAAATSYQFSPGEVSGSGSSPLGSGNSLADQNAIEYAAYLDNEQTISPKLTAQYGFRLSAWNFLGPYTTYQYTGTNGQRKQPMNEQSYGDDQTISTYANLEPRLSLRYQLNANSSIKASYNRTAQYVHLISNTTAGSPLDIWWPTTNNTKPELADQVALGYFKNFGDNRYEASVEGYYKTLTNQVDYIDGANTRLNKHLEGDLLYGQGRAYGMEVYVKKNAGRINGWLSYTLSRTERQIDGINNNEWYRAKYDRTHNLSIVGIYEASKKWTLSANFTYQTGVATTFPSSKYYVQDIAVPQRSDNARNNYRVPAYHRLDLSATLHPNPRADGRPRRGDWTFSLYNAYNRRNAFSVYFQQDEDNPSQTNATRLSIFGSVIPSATYNFHF
ncbi:TonB-dependent receptor [Spirosoma sordidisoli]|nr:TonB-dependent receptor [Spirosoma sordidisoli]